MINAFHKHMIRNIDVTYAGEHWYLPIEFRHNIGKSVDLEFASEAEEQQWKDLQKSTVSKEIKTREYFEENPLKYKINKDGFRNLDGSPFVKGSEVNIFLGCSDTFGIGMHIEDTWSYKLNKNHEGEYWNLGIPGTGVETQFRMLYHLVTKFDVKINNVFHWLPFRNRHEFLISETPWNDKPEFVISVPREEDAIFKQLPDQVKEHLMSDSTAALKNISYTSAIDKLVSDRGGNYLVLNHDLVWSNPKLNIRWKGQYDMSKSFVLARDLGHPNYQTHHDIFSAFMYAMNEKDIPANTVGKLGNNFANVWNSKII
tara:strand:- start:6842 stop:7783 length:942 start_codon:yes stop_codon:yes gene_type:complete